MSLSSLLAVLVIVTVPTLVAAAGLPAPSLFPAGVKQCHVCKTAQAASTFSNLVCDRIPPMAPDCDNFNTSSLTYLQHCSANQLCLFISKGEEQLRMCTTKQVVDTLRTTKGILMTVCDRELCNAAGQTSAPPMLMMLLPLLVATVTAAAGAVRQ